MSQQDKRRTVGHRGRALGGGDLRRVYRSGTRHATEVATLHILPLAQKHCRVAIPVAKRIGSAVARNRVRRRLREAFRELEQEVSSGGDIVIVARPSAAVADFRDLVAQLQLALKESGLIDAI